MEERVGERRRVGFLGLLLSSLLRRGERKKITADLGSMLF
jgi:hypothetical protein